jgi:hypothetical protein
MATYYANPDETTFTGATFTFRFGAYGETTVVVLQRPGCIDSALETAAECLKEHAPGHFSEPDYAAAKNEIMGETGAGDDMISEEAIAERAETDHTYTESGWLLSWERTVDESEGEPFESPHFDRFDVPVAHATYWAAWHQGQGSDGYRDLSRALTLMGNGFIPDRGFDGLSENGQAIYRQLVLRDGR